MLQLFKAPFVDDIEFDIKNFYPKLFHIEFQPFIQRPVSVDDRGR